MIRNNRPMRSFFEPLFILRNPERFYFFDDLSRALSLLIIISIATTQKAKNAMSRYGTCPSLPPKSGQQFMNPSFFMLIYFNIA